MPAAVTAWVFIAVLGLFIYSTVGYLCPVNESQSGFCTAPWAQTVGEVIIIFTIALATLGVGISAVAVAPSHKKQVLWVTYILGSIIALSFYSNSTEDYVFTAIGTGLLGMVAINNYLEKNNKRSSSSIG